MHVYVLKEGVVGVQVVSLVCERSRCPCVIATYMDYMMDVLPTTCRQQTRQQLKSEKKRLNARRWRRARSCVQCSWLSKYEYLRTSLEGACNTVVPDWPWPLSTLDARRGAKRLTSNVTAPRSGRRKSGPTSCRWSSCATDGDGIFYSRGLAT